MSSKGVQSVQRALDVLEEVARAGELGVTEIAQAVGLAPSTAHGLISTLAARGYLARASIGYRLGAAAAGLASAWDPGLNLPLQLDPLLEKLSHAVNAASAATVLIGHEVRIVAAQPSPGRIATHLSIGGWKDPLDMATGRVLIAREPRQRWGEFIERTAQSPRPSPSWHHELARIHAIGASFKPSRDPHGAVSLGMPVFRRGQDVVCAIGCYVPTYFARELFTEASFDALREVCAEASALFGGTFPDTAFDPGVAQHYLRACPASTI